MSPPITPFIWFDADPHEVRDYYAGIFDDFETVSELRGPDGVVLGFTVSIDGLQVSLFNGGPDHPQTDSFSLMILTDDQDQTDRYWNALSAEGEESVCGWLKDKYGVNWQVTPRLMMEILASDEAEGRKRAFDAMLTMRKLIVADLQAAYDGE
jgi:2-polyprenyl-6-hydroxyphenyl methylase/3-demethylubiquinone-9 3-methyltransferase